MVRGTRTMAGEIGEIYFWTATINNWQLLLQPEEYKKVVIDSLDHLSGKGKVDVFAPAKVRVSRTSMFL